MVLLPLHKRSLRLKQLLTCFCWHWFVCCHRHEHGLHCCRKQKCTKAVLGETDCTAALWLSFTLALVDNQITHLSLTLLEIWDAVLQCLPVMAVISSDLSSERVLDHVKLLKTADWSSVWFPLHGASSKLPVHKQCQCIVCLLFCPSALTNTS